jgi:ABC-type spermidine/putrescine transport system permease subunit I
MNKLKLIQAIGEAVIPLLGFFYFEWNLYFIILFYFIDLVTTEVFLHLKINQILKFQSVRSYPKKWKVNTLVNTFLVLLVLIGTHFVIAVLYPGISFKQEFVDFVMYEEAGVPIPQGFILLPIVVFGNYQQYKTMFLRPKLYQKQSWSFLLYSRRSALLTTLIGIAIGFTIAYFVSIPIVIYLMMIVGVKFIIDYKYTV